MTSPSGQFTTLDGRRYYEISAYDDMPPFFMTLISSSDLWLFLSSYGGLTAGRGAPEQALFPYVTADQLHRNGLHTGSRTWIRVQRGSETLDWEPFNLEQCRGYAIERSLFKDELGTRVIFRERNTTLGLVFSYAWTCANAHGIVREARLEALDAAVVAELVDGVLNLLPSETLRSLQNTSSNLVDAYKWNELDPTSGLASYSLYAKISDRAEPAESLSAAIAYALGLEDATVYLAASDFDALRRGRTPAQQRVKRGVPGAYLLHTTLALAAGEARDWQIVLDTALPQSGVVARRHALADSAKAMRDLRAAIEAEHERLRELLASADAFQAVNKEVTACHHTANALFNVMRGGVFDRPQRIDRDDFVANLRLRNRDVAARHAAWLAQLPAEVPATALHQQLQALGDAQLNRLSREYLPLVFGRRHGDPSRPWNHFSIRGRDAKGRLIHAYQGNWRDIFQNWEALLLSFPEFTPNVIGKFVNATTLDGYNPYRIDHTGIDWEVEEPDDPWSNIGYWGDHQLIYLLRLIELCDRVEPARLRAMLQQSEFSYANVPYQIAPFQACLADPKHTVSFDHALAAQIAKQVDAIGSDGKLIGTRSGEVLLVTLAEKLLVPLLAKLGNLVPGGGIWLNTQRPEWNDANNALVGAGLSMVTLYHARRYTQYLIDLLGSSADSYLLSNEIAQWLRSTALALPEDNAACVEDSKARWQVFAALGEAASQHRERIYARRDFGTRSEVQSAEIVQCLSKALATLDRSIAYNRRPDGLYHAYNLIVTEPGEVKVDTLYPMLEGQVAVLSSGVLNAGDTVRLLEALYASDLYRADQHSFMLYPDPPLKGFLEKNRIPADQAAGIEVLNAMLARGDTRLIERDAEGSLRFAHTFANAKDLAAGLSTCAADYPALDAKARAQILALYEHVFAHHSFTGRSGTMFGFEGRGSIYWHMVSKLLLATQEALFAALERNEDPAACAQIAAYYFRIREGIGFNKTPAEYGAFPCDPYSHTPGHAGAQQPGMTGQVKEEVISRFGELGIQIRDGQIRFTPAVLSRSEFNTTPREFRYLDALGRWRELALQPNELAFTLCQVPFVLKLATTDAGCSARVHDAAGRTQHIHADALPEACCAQIFQRSGEIERVEIIVPASALTTDA